MITPAPSKLPRSADVVIIGAGNAAFCAAHAAAEHGVSVLVLERAPEEESAATADLRPARSDASMTASKTYVR